MLSGWGGPLVAFVVLWAIVAIACVPAMLSARLREPIENWPTDRLGINYVLTVGAVVLGQAVVFLGGVVVAGGIGGIEAVEWTLLVGVGYPLVAWLAISIAAPATGRWSPSTTEDGGVDGRIVLALVAVWYAVVVAVVALVVFFLLFVLYFPG